MPPASSQSQHKKNLAVKRQDGEPLTRVDLQYDMLHAIFADRHAAFTDPHTTIRGDPAGTRVTFRDLYVNALIHSPKCSKASRDKIRESPEFGNEFAMISLLSNVGRINTTMAFFPEMKTALRTYHPVPALQRTNGNLQDAPRIKNILKSCFMPGEGQGMCTTPGDVLARPRSGKIPPTSIVNLIFVFANHSPTIARTHFPPLAAIDFLDLFTPVRISSKSRARAFLWLCYHYHEAPSPNPFSDANSEDPPDWVPLFVYLTDTEARAENIDTAEEHQRGLDMTDLRRRFLETKAKEFSKDPEGDLMRPQDSGTKVRGKGKGKDLAETGSLFRMREVSPADSQYSVPYSFRDEDMLEGPGRPPFRRLSSSGPQDLPERRHLSPHRQHSPRGYSDTGLIPRGSLPRAAADPYPRPPLGPNIDLLHTNGKPVRAQSRKHRGPAPHAPLFVHEPYPCSSAPTRSVFNAPQYTPSSPDTPKRSMLEQAWHVSMTTDPLVDSDDEAYADENTRLDYVLRLRIISRLRGKEPTPPRELGPYRLTPVHSAIAPLGTR
ncbi:hypothetical protein LXA43DRAFT_981710 [Ganoderma leucocontextum]|nr:hypothetical protein LXA43DRAFT_981710 [Ganoderma leucocontextum]